jgi:putative flavoprotein involved in K+ transport
VIFADGQSTDVDGVVWATGYRERSDWVEIPAAKDGAGRLLERRGVSPVPGLYLRGRDWQWSRGSGLLVGVGRDADYVAGRIVERLTVSATCGVVQPA